MDLQPGQAQKFISRPLLFIIEDHRIYGYQLTAPAWGQAL
jgi:hypothetical protein